MTSLRRTGVPFKRYSLMPSRCTTRSTTTSLKSRSRSRLELSNTTFIPARFMRGSAGEPPQMRSSPFFERMDFIDCSPKTKRKASATLDLPDPLGPTIAAMGEAKRSSVFFPKDLKPESSMDLRLRNIDFHFTPSLASHRVCFEKGPSQPRRRREEQIRQQTDTRVFRKIYSVTRSLPAPSRKGFLRGILFGFLFRTALARGDFFLPDVG